ncbi:MAG: type II toxin-antitoxin system VapC family toxin [Euryarchaeota archaeon]|nr:type II toxin-antitoxin system VapC family toxin [Euryarchaeota archaeon]
MILVDSDVLIDVLRKEPRAVDALRRQRETGEVIGSSSVSVAEVLRGCARDEATLAVATRVLEAITEVPFGPKSARRFGRLMHTLDRAGARIPTVDGMVAATALEEGGRLMTRNGQDFARVAGLEILSP